MESEENLRRLLAVKARTAHDRFGLTHELMVSHMYSFSKRGLEQGHLAAGDHKPGLRTVILWRSQLHIPPLRHCATVPCATDDSHRNTANVDSSSLQRI